MTEVFEGNWNGFKLGDANKSLTYILPMLGSKATEFIDKYHPLDLFVNCFIGDVEKRELQDCVLLLYKFHGSKAFLDFEEKLQLNQQYRGQYLADYLHTMYIFEVPNIHLSNYDNFKRSKYSAFDSAYKQHIQNFHKLAVSSPIMDVLNKGEPMYKYWENKISHLVSNTKVPREQECGTAIKQHEEYYMPEYKLQRVLTIQKEFEDGN